MASFDDPLKLRGQAGAAIGKIPNEVETESVTAGGVDAEWVRWKGTKNDAVILYLHGGGYVFGGVDSHRGLAWRLAKACASEVLVVDYRLAPEHRFPAPVEDAIASYRWLLAQGFSSQQIIIAGDSAGGGLAAALMVELKTLSLPQPKAAVLLSPWTDLTRSGDSVQENAAKDAMLSPSALKKFADLYLGDSDPKSAAASPVFADLSELAPTYVIVGGSEVLLDDSKRLTENICNAGGRAELVVWPGMPHVFPLLASIIPEGDQAIQDIAKFVREQLGKEGASVGTG